MLFKLPGREEEAYGTLEPIFLPVKGGGSSDHMALWVDGLPYGTREVAGWELTQASPAEEAALSRAGYVIPKKEQVASIARIFARVGGASGRGGVKSRPPDHYKKMVERRRELGMVKVNNRERQRLGHERKLVEEEGK